MISLVLKVNKQLSQRNHQLKDFMCSGLSFVVSTTFKIPVFIRLKSLPHALSNHCHFLSCHQSLVFFSSHYTLQKTKKEFVFMAVTQVPCSWFPVTCCGRQEPVMRLSCRPGCRAHQGLAWHIQSCGLHVRACNICEIPTSGSELLIYHARCDLKSVLQKMQYSEKPIAMDPPPNVHLASDIFMSLFLLLSKAPLEVLFPESLQLCRHGCLSILN